MKKLLVAALIGASALGGAAIAQNGPPGLANLFPDPNGDGVTTKDEMVAAAVARFNAADTNKDGKLSAEERAAAGPGFGGRGPNAPQGDQTLADVKAAAEARFDRMDANHDGKIDAAERQAILDRFQNMRPGAGGPPPAASGNMPPPPTNQ
jgi:hypothetical protein